MNHSYATLEQIKAAATWRGPAEDATILERALSQTGKIERELHRWFYPRIQTRLYDFPSRDSGPYRLWLKADLLSVESLVTAGVEIEDYFLEPVNHGPPYSRIDLSIAAGQSFRSGVTWQRQIAIEGLWGYSQDRESAGALVGSINDAVVTFSVTDSSLIGAGDLLFLEDEAIVVRGKVLMSTTAVQTEGLDAESKDQTVAVDAGTKVKQGEVITVDAERMLVLAVVGNVMQVQRSFDGSALAQHEASAVVYAPRTLTVERAQAGTAAASHNGVAIGRNVPPGLVRDLVIAEVIATRNQEEAGYGRQTGAGEAEQNTDRIALLDLRKKVRDLYGRSRSGAV